MQLGVRLCLNQEVCVYVLGCVWFSVAPWTVALQAPLSVGFPRSELPFPSPVNLPDPGIELGSPTLQADSLPTELWGKPQHGEAPPVRYLSSPKRNCSQKSHWMAGRALKVMASGLPSPEQEFHPVLEKWGDLFRHSYQDQQSQDLKPALLKLKLQLFGHFGEELTH